MHSIRLTSPAPPLRDCVRFYASRQVQTGRDVVVHPVPARVFPLIEFAFGDRFQVLHTSQSRIETSPRAAIVGLQTRCGSELQFQGSVECFVILFQPTGLHRLFATPAHELTDRAYEAHAVLGGFVSRLEEMLGGTSSFEERVRLADRFLLRHSAKAGRFDRMSAAARDILCAGGDVRIVDLADNAGLGVRQFERSFMEHVGVPPKLYARIVRFEWALDTKARSSTKSWTDVAHECGYYDQMHMVHDFEAFTGRSPTEILGEVERLFRPQIHAIRSGHRSATPGDLQLIL